MTAPANNDAPAQFSGQQTGPSWPHLIWYWPAETIVEYIRRDHHGRIEVERVVIEREAR